MNELRNSHLGNNDISILASEIFTDLILSVWSLPYIKIIKLKLSVLDPQ